LANDRTAAKNRAKALTLALLKMHNTHASNPIKYADTETPWRDQNSPAEIDNWSEAALLDKQLPVRVR
jgi:hypothetical protein